MVVSCRSFLSEPLQLFVDWQEWPQTIVVFFWGGFDVDDFPNQSMYLLFSEAFNWCQDMDTQSIQPNAVTLTAVLRTLGRSGQATTARELAERMERYGMLPEWEIPSGYD